ncbi:MAG: hypothetical protein COX32_02830 [Candidatus Moranbacteria bacterium CG23_combo_of_CG06-09_8_20_14_all_41_28]|nr:MAG: hypothetical protein COX32_02830 [Candidatus Moranbacteria bacterium CG23_combo_of_CG06-09_8_20_14_all_41_28]
MLVKFTLQGGEEHALVNTSMILRVIEGPGEGSTIYMSGEGPPLSVVETLEVIPKLIRMASLQLKT